MGVTNYVWDGQQYLMETDGSNTTQAVWTNEPDQYTNLVSQRRAGTTHYAHFDALGSTRGLTDDGEIVTDDWSYGAWGNVVSHSGTTDFPFQFIGRFGYRYDSENDSFYIVHRIYEPETGRWLSVDPNWISVDPISFNRSSQTVTFSGYVYAVLNPIMFIDPNGLEAWERDSDIALLGKQYFGPWPAQRGGQNISECADFQIPIVTTKTFTIKLIGKNDDAEITIPVVGPPELGDPKSVILSQKDNRKRLDKIPCYKSVWVNQLCKKSDGCTIIMKTFYIALTIPGKLRFSVGVASCNTKDPKTSFDPMNNIGDIIKELNEKKVSICNSDRAKEEKPEKLIGVLQGPEIARESCNNPVLH